jgi:hypothetical protein
VQVQEQVLALQEQVQVLALQEQVLLQPGAQVLFDCFP